MSLVERFAFYLICGGLFIYLVLRAIYVPIVGDEAATFFNYIHVNQFLPGLSRVNTNNHFLNSFLSIVFSNIFGNSLLVIRLANLLSFSIYTYSLFQIGKLIHQTIARWAFFSALLFSAFLMEFFSMSRGYGLSISFLMLSIHYVIRTLEQGKSRDYALATISIVLSTMANLTLINTLVIMCIYLVVISISRGQKKGLIPVLSIGGTAILFFGALSLFYKTKGLLWYGSADGFWNVTVSSLGRCLVNNGLLFSIVFSCFSLFALGSLLFAFKKDGFRLNTIYNPRYTIIFLLFANIASSYCLNLILDVNFPKERGAIYFIPLIIGSAAFGLDALSSAFGKFTTAPLLILFILPVQFISIANISNSKYWPLEALPPDFYYEIIQDNRASTIGGSRLYKYMWGYQNLLNRGKLNHWQCRNYPNQFLDYQIIAQKDTSIFSDNYNTVLSHTNPDLLLIKRKKPLKKRYLFSTVLTSFSESDKKYFNFIPFSDSISFVSKRPFLIDFEIDAKTRSPFFKASLIATFTGENNKLHRFEDYPLDWQCDNLNGKLTGQLIIFPPEKQLSFLTVYLANIHRNNFDIRSVKITVSQLD